jgi:hypothetical protein
MSDMLNKLEKNILRNAIINAKDCNIKPEEVPEWGCTVYLREWNGKDRSMFWSRSIRANENGAEVNWDTLFDNQVLAVAMSLCDEEGNKLFDTTDKDLTVLAAKKGDVIQRLYTKSIEINGLAANSVEEAAKNSLPAQSEDSIST